MSEGRELLQDRANARREMFRLERALIKVQTDLADAIVAVAICQEQLDNKDNND